MAFVSTRLPLLCLEDGSGTGCCHHAAGAVSTDRCAGQRGLQAEPHWRARPGCVADRLPSPPAHRLPLPLLHRELPSRFQGTISCSPHAKDHPRPRLLPSLRPGPGLASSSLRPPTHTYTSAAGPFTRNHEPGRDCPHRTLRTRPALGRAPWPVLF